MSDTIGILTLIRGDMRHYVRSSLLCTEIETTSMLWMSIRMRNRALNSHSSFRPSLSVSQYHREQSRIVACLSSVWSDKYPSWHYYIATPLPTQKSMHFRDSKNSEHFESHQTRDVSQFLVLPLYTRRDTNPLQVPEESFEIVFHPLRVKAQSLWSHIRRIRVQSRLHRMRSSQRHDLLRTENWLYLLMHYLCSCVVSILKDMIKILSQHSGLIFLN